MRRNCSENTLKWGQRLLSHGMLRFVKSNIAAAKESTSHQLLLGDSLLITPQMFKLVTFERVYGIFLVSFVPSFSSDDWSPFLLNCRHQLELS